MIEKFLGSTTKIGVCWGVYPVLIIIVAITEARNCLKGAAAAAASNNKCEKYLPANLVPEMKLVAYAFWISLALGDFFTGLLGAIQFGYLARAGIITVCWCVVGIFLSFLPNSIQSEEGTVESPSLELGPAPAGVAEPGRLPPRNRTWM